MLDRSILSNQLKYFSIVYQSKSYVVGAKAIPMSPQGLTKSIHALEKALDVPLFESAGGAPLKPTIFADHLYRLVQEWHEDARSLDSIFQRLKSSSEKVLTIGASTGTLGIVGIDIARRFSRSNPTLRLRCIEMPDYPTDAYLAEGEYNLALTTMPYDEGFSTIDLYETEICAWVPTSNPLSRNRTLSPHDLGGQHIGVVDSSFKVFTELMAALAAAKTEPASISTSSEVFWLHRFACEGKGIGIGTPHVSDRLALSDDIVQVSMPFIHWSFGLSVRKGYRLSPEEEAVASFIIESMHPQGNAT